ncbi:MAG: glycosyltransferase family 2 protein [Chthoniobacterales bacterium]
MKPQVSIIIATFNRAQLLPIAVASALQAGRDPEVIVVDDASTDKTSAVCQSLVGVRVLRLSKNVGLAAARNAGIEQSRGEFIALLDDDDRRLPDTLPAQLHSLGENPQAAFSYARVLLGDCQTGEPTGASVPQEIHAGDIFWKLARANFIPGLSVVMRRQALLEVGLFNPKLRQVEDWDLWLRMSERWPVAAIEQPVAIYRMFERSSAQLSSKRALMVRAAAAVQRAALRRPRARADETRRRACRRNFLREMRHTLLLETAEALLAGEKKAARSYLRTVLALAPAEWSEVRELGALAISRTKATDRGFVKRVKAARKQLWARARSDETTS